MPSSKSVPRILQKPPAREGEQPVRLPANSHPPEPDETLHKGDWHSPVESPKPSREREVGDLEEAERESHAQA